MAVALISYFGTMVAAFVGFMLLLNSVLTSPLLAKTHPYPHPAVEIEQTVAEGPAINSPNIQAQDTHARDTQARDMQAQATNADVSRVASAKPVTVEKSKRLKVARAQTRRVVTQRVDLARREDSAGRRQDQEYSTTLSYAQEAQQQAASTPLFDFIQPRHF